MSATGADSVIQIEGTEEIAAEQIFWNLLVEWKAPYVWTTQANWPWRIKHRFRIQTQTLSRDFQKRATKFLKQSICRNYSLENKKLKQGVLWEIQTKASSRALES